MGPAARGWWVIAACIVAILAALTLVIRRITWTAPALWVAAVCSLAGALVPVVILADPGWFMGDFLHAIGEPADSDTARDLLNVPVIVFCLVAMVVLAFLCAAIAVTVSPPRWRISITRTDAPASTDQKPVIRSADSPPSE